MTTIESFSGTHAYNPTCARASVELDWFEEFEIGLNVLSQVHADGVTERLETGICPRCDGPIDLERTAGSRVTTCRCIPICPACGEDEAFQPALGRPMSRIWQWPISRGHRTRRRNKVMEQSVVTTGILSGSTLITEDGAHPIQLRANSGGWAEHGMDEEVSR